MFPLYNYVFLYLLPTYCNGSLKMKDKFCGWRYWGIRCGIGIKNGRSPHPLFLLLLVAVCPYVPPLWLWLRLGSNIFSIIRSANSCLTQFWDTSQPEKHLRPDLRLRKTRAREDSLSIKSCDFLPRTTKNIMKSQLILFVGLLVSSGLTLPNFASRDDRLTLICCNFCDEDADCQATFDGMSLYIAQTSPYRLTPQVLNVDRRGYQSAERSIVSVRCIFVALQVIRMKSTASKEKYWAIEVIFELKLSTKCQWHHMSTLGLYHSSSVSCHAMTSMADIIVDVITYIFSLIPFSWWNNQSTFLPLNHCVET